MQWGAITVEFIGLMLITVELYFPNLSETLKKIFEDTQPRFMKRPVIWVGSYIVFWIVVVSLISIGDGSLSIVANLLFTFVTVLTLVLVGISRLLVRLGVVLGRGNSVGGVGLVLALVGFSIELLQLVLN